jgi:hypothetical protein
MNIGTKVKTKTGDLVGNVVANRYRFGEPQVKIRSDEIMDGRPLSVEWHAAADVEKVNRGDDR